MVTQFRCRECGSSGLNEVMTGVTVTSFCNFEHGELVYGEQSNDDGEVVSYQCSNGHIVKDAEGDIITETDDLMQYLGDYPLLNRKDVIGLIADRLKQLSDDELVTEYLDNFPTTKAEAALKRIGVDLFKLEEKL